jgi:hypothetical protein
MNRPTPVSAAGKLAVLVAVLFLAASGAGYSVLTHEELIDLAWNDSIRPLLLAKFPHATQNQLREAHAYAYGGSAIQDMGYYPFGKPLFSNLTHYVRSGDFVACLLQNASTIDEYAFAIGALSHYLGDTIGHSQAINPATAIAFPNLAKKYGSKVTYGESPHGHIRTEFAFDIDELTNEEFAPPAYLRAVGFKVPRKFLERAFTETYGFDLHEVLGRARSSLRSYRTSVRSFIPSFAEAEVVLHSHQFPPHPDSAAYRLFAERVAHTDYDRHWRQTYRDPGFKAHLLAILVWIVPKIGGAADLAIKIPTTDTEETYLRSVNHTVDVFRETLHKMSGSAPVTLANLDLDTGDPAKVGDYELADQAYSQLLDRLTTKRDRNLPAALKRHLIDYYADPSGMSDPPERTKRQLAALGVILVAPGTPSP